MNKVTQYSSDDFGELIREALEVDPKQREIVEPSNIIVLLLLVTAILEA